MKESEERKRVSRMKQVEVPKITIKTKEGVEQKIKDDGKKGERGFYSF